MATAMCVYVAESSFTSMTKVTEHTKAMIDSWQINTNTQPSSLYFNPTIGENTQGRSQPTASDYQNYSWLFRGM
jgi:hypothetical protein